MLDIKLIRENPEKINELLKRRNPELSIDTIIAIDADRRKVQAQADELRAKRKSESQKIGMLKKSGENTDAIQEEVRKLGDEIKELEEKQVDLDNIQRDMLLRTPNIPDETTPIGESEDDNITVKTWSKPTQFTFTPKPHWDLCEEKGIVDHDLYHKILKTMHDKYGCNVILLGCTELSLAQEKAPDHPYHVIDPQSIIADVSIELALKIRNGMDPKEACAKYMYK